MAKLTAYCAASFLIFALMIGAIISSAAAAESSDGANAQAEPQLEEVVITARRREENLQSVPDAVTAFTASTIVNSGIEHIEDFAALVPNLTFQDGNAFRAGEFNLSMRGIGNGQEGWPSVSYIVDGVPEDSTDSINSGSLEDIERIEVLRGPQSALYGFNAIAGAINVITKSPTNDFQSEARVLYGNGDDRQAGVMISGPLIPDTLLFRVNASYRDNDGLIRSASNGLDLDFTLQKQLAARLVFTPTDKFKFDFKASFDKEHNGSTYEDKVIGGIAAINDFSADTDPRRAFPGADDRTLYKFSARVQWDLLETASLVSVTGYSHIDQHIFSSLCYDDPNDPIAPAPGGGGQCLFGAAFGNAAAPGQPSDNYFDSIDNLRTFTQDVRLESRGNGPLHWTVGASTLFRDYLSGFDAGTIVAPDSTLDDLFPAWNDKRDDWWGVYGQLIWSVTSRFELTAAGRYDDERYNNTTYTDRSESTVIPVLTPSGKLTDTQRETADAFQPKGQASYHFTDDVMGYVTVSRGFRAGYFDTGTYTLPEHTTNYEAGIKSTLWDRRIVANTAIFHIDYSDQQFSSIINTYPFRVSTSIPKTNINGVEYESTLIASRFASFNLGLGYLHAVVSDGTASPGAPRLNANAGMDLTYPVFLDWKARLHVDDRYNSSQFLSTGDTQPVAAKNYVNLRAGFENSRYNISAFVRNLTNERQATYPGSITAGGYIRYPNEPRSYGVEARVTF
jgi:iron complex outermembrane receptor protein